MGRMAREKQSTPNPLPLSRGGTGATTAAAARAALGVEAALASGVILPFGGSAVPTGWLECNGAAVSRATYADLFASLGIAYGAGDGLTTFNVPELRGKVPVGDDGATYQRGNTGGAASVSLNANQIPVHTHAVGTLANAAEAAHTHATGGYSTDAAGAHSHERDPSGAFIGISAGGGNSITAGTAGLRVDNYYTDTEAAHTHVMSGSSAAGSSHNHVISGDTGNNTSAGNAVDVRQPYGVTKYIIRA